MLDHLDALAIRVGDRPAKLFLGNGPLGLEVVEVPLGGRPRITDLRALFRGRVGRRAAPVLIIAPWGNARAAVSGPTEHNLIEHRDLPMEQVEAVCRKALEADGRHAAIRLLHQLLPQLDTPIPGLRNGGLFAMQELEHGVPARGDWGLAVPLLPLRETSNYFWDAPMLPSGVIRLPRIPLAVLAFSVLVGCSGDSLSPTTPRTPPPLVVSMTPASAEVEVGGTAVFTLQVGGGASGSTARWTCASSDTGVATASVTDSGCSATGVATGDVTITANIEKGGAISTVASSLSVMGASSFGSGDMDCERGNRAWALLREPGERLLLDAAVRDKRVF